MVAFKNHSAVTAANVGEDITPMRLAQFNLRSRADIQVFLEPPPLSADQRRAASAARLPPNADLTLIAIEEEPAE